MIAVFCVDCHATPTLIQNSDNGSYPDLRLLKFFDDSVRGVVRKFRGIWRDIAGLVGMPSRAGLKVFDTE